MEIHGRVFKLPQSLVISLVVKSIKLGLTTPDIIEKFSHLPSDWIVWEQDIIVTFSHLALDWISWEQDKI